MATPGGTFAFADPQPTDGAVIEDSTTGDVTGGIYSTSYTIEYTTPDCTTTGEITFTVLDGDDSSFEMTPTCDGAVVILQPWLRQVEPLLLLIHSQPMVQL